MNLVERVKAILAAAEIRMAGDRRRAGRRRLSVLELCLHRLRDSAGVHVHRRRRYRLWADSTSESWPDCCTRSSATCSDLVGVFVMAYVIDYLAGVFDGQRNFDNAMKVSAYAPTAAWVAGVFHIIPFLGVLSILGLYSIYLLHTGIAALMKPPESKAIIYTIAVIVCVFVVYLVIFGIVGALFGVGMISTMGRM